MEPRRGARARDHWAKGSGCRLVHDSDTTAPDGSETPAGLDSPGCERDTGWPRRARVGARRRLASTSTDGSETPTGLNETRWERDADLPQRAPMGARRRLDATAPDASETPAGRAGLTPAGDAVSVTPHRDVIAVPAGPCTGMLFVGQSAARAPIV